MSAPPPTSSSSSAPLPPSSTNPSAPLSSASASASSSIRSALKRSPEKTYTGPARGSLPPLRSKAEADVYFAKMGGENMLPTRANKLLGVGGWVAGGFACFYMAIYADFGEQEHVFSPLRRQYSSLMGRLFTLSPSERQIVGLQQPRAQEEKRPS